MAGNAPENMSLESALSADTDTGAGTEGQSGAELPSIAANSDFSDESVAITGQAGQVSAYAGMGPDRPAATRALDRKADPVARAGGRRGGRAACLAGTAAEEDSAEPSAAVVLAVAAGLAVVADAAAAVAVAAEAVEEGAATSAASIPASPTAPSRGIAPLPTSTRSRSI